MKRLVNNDRAAENVMQQRLLAIAVRRFSRTLAPLIAAASTQMLEKYKATGGPPNMPEDFQQRMAQEYADMAARMIDVFGGRILDQGKSLGHDLETKNFAELFQRLAEEYIQQEAIRRRIAMVSETTRKWIVDTILQGQQVGDSVDVISSRISKLIPSISRFRAHVIARTETHGAANFGADQAARATGLKLRKEWVATQDARTRDFGEGDGEIDDFNHRAADGQIVDMDQPFRIKRKNGTEEQLMFPGDPTASPGNVINCRCSVAHIVDD